MVQTWLAAPDPTGALWPAPDAVAAARHDQQGSRMETTATPGAIQETQSLLPFLVYSLSVVGVLAVTLVLAWFLGSRTRQRPATALPFESGIVSVGSAAELRLSVEFYLIAMFFVIFDLETIFIFAWAVAFYDLGWRGYLGSALLAALVYEWRTGALDWGIKQRVARQPGGYAADDEVSG